MIVNVQADEPLISPSTIQSAVAAIQQDPDADIVTTFERVGTPVTCLIRPL